MNLGTRNFIKIIYNNFFQNWDDHHKYCKNSTFPMKSKKLLTASIIAVIGALIVIPTGVSYALNLVGTSGPDVIDGTDSADRITTGDGDDNVSGKGGNDRISTGNGEDIVSGGDGADKITTGNGDDTIDLSETSSSIDRVECGEGIDTVSNADGNDILLGCENVT